MKSLKILLSFFLALIAASAAFAAVPQTAFSTSTPTTQTLFRSLRGEESPQSFTDAPHTAGTEAVLAKIKSVHRGTLPKPYAADPTGNGEIPAFSVCGYSRLSPVLTLTSNAYWHLLFLSQAVAGCRSTAPRAPPLTHA